MRVMSKKILTAKTLRQNMTKAESLVWQRIRNSQLGAKFRRQQPIEKYIPDFVCFEKKIVIEVDGSQHIDDPQDLERDKWFAENDYTVLRYFNNQVMSDLDAVITSIYETINP